MENTKENVVKLLRLRSHQYFDLYENLLERHQNLEAQKYLSMSCEVDSIINLLTDEEHFTNMWNIWKEELEEQEQCQKKSS